MAEDDNSVKISMQPQESPAQLAAERHTTLRDLVEHRSVAAPTAADFAERERRARTVLAEHFGIEVGPTELAASARLREVIVRRSAAA